MSAVCLCVCGVWRLTSLSAMSGLSDLEMLTVVVLLCSHSGPLHQQHRTYNNNNSSNYHSNCNNCNNKKNTWIGYCPALLRYKYIGPGLTLWVPSAVLECDGVLPETWDSQARPGQETEKTGTALSSFESPGTLCGQWYWPASVTCPGSWYLITSSSCQTPGTTLPANNLARGRQRVKLVCYEIFHEEKITPTSAKVASQQICAGGQNPLLHFYIFPGSFPAN